MDTFFISDLHYAHKNILRFTKRPFDSVEEMHEGIVADWNEVVRPHDVVYHLGDLCFLDKRATYEEWNRFYDWMNRLNGRLVCLKGNHDYSNLLSDYRKAQADGLLRHDITFSDSPYEKIKVNKKMMVLCHYPIAVWDRKQYGSVHLHGHCHNGLTLDLGKAMDVGYDALWENYELRRPISHQEVVDIMAQKENVFFDHHTEKDKR